MTKLQSKLQELRELVEAKTVECPHCQGYDASLRSQGLTHDLRTEQPLCIICDADGRIPDPAYAPLLKVVRMHCICSGIYDNSSWYCGCNGTGYITRSWETLPEGALAGALEVATKSLSLLFPYPWDLIYANGKEDATALEYTLYVLKEETK